MGWEQGGVWEGKKGKKENHFLNSSYNVWKTFIHSIHLSGFHVITPDQKKNSKKRGWREVEGGEANRDSGF